MEVAEAYPDKIILYGEYHTKKPQIDKDINIDRKSDQLFIFCLSSCFNRYPKCISSICLIHVLIALQWIVLSLIGSLYTIHVQDIY